MKNRITADKKMSRSLHQYTIGEMASLLRMPAPTIRFYDSQGAVVPQRDDENQYRRYTVVDGNYLLKLKELKNVGASLSETAQLLNHADLESYLEGFRDLKKAQEERIQRDQLLLEGMKRKIALIESLGTEQGHITLEKRPAFWRFDHQINDRFLDGKAWNDARCAWTDLTPAADLSFLFSVKDEQHQLHWGFSMEQELAVMMGLDQQCSDFFPSVQCVRYVFSTCDEVFLQWQNLQPAVSYIENHGFLLAGDIVGRSLARVMSPENAVIHYYDAWFPIKDQEFTESDPA